MGPCHRMARLADTFSETRDPCGPALRPPIPIVFGLSEDRLQTQTQRLAGRCRGPLIFNGSPHRWAYCGLY